MTKHILVTVKYTLRPGTREEFCRELMESGIAAASREEAGNIQYDLSLPLDSADDLCILERWRDADAQKTHTASAHYQRLNALKKRYVLEARIDSYTVLEA